MLLPALFHWSPSEKREAILGEGLRIYAEPCVHRGGLTYPYVCLGFTPSGAWSLSGDMDWVDEFDSWDLWQVRLAEADTVHVRPEFGPVLLEARVRNTIPADRVWWVAERRALAALTARQAVGRAGA